MFATKKLAAALIFALVFSAAAVYADQAVANPESGTPSVLAMPVEYVNYTITSINGTLWAKIDGVYPLHVVFWQGALPLVYPTPPNTTNITVKVDDTELDWGNFTEIYPEARHYTAIGDWTMINCTIDPVPEYFTLKIHYEHPVEVINGTHTFLYDLNIRTYLAEQSPKSTAYFTVRMETNYANLQMNNISTEDTLTPINYTTTTDDTAKTLAFQIISEYNKPLLGDILITFTTPQPPNNTEPTYLLTIIPIAIIAALIALAAYKTRKR